MIAQSGLSSYEQQRAIEEPNPCHWIRGGHKCRDLLLLKKLDWSMLASFGCQLLEFKLDGGNVRLNGFFDQTDGYQYLRALLVALPKAQTADFYEALLPCCLGLLGCRLTDQSPVFCIS